MPCTADFSRWTFDAGGRLPGRAAAAGPGDAGRGHQRAGRDHRASRRGARGDVVGRSGGPAPEPPHRADALGRSPWSGRTGPCTRCFGPGRVGGAAGHAGGRYYVDGVLAESPAPAPGGPGGGSGEPGWRIADQPYLATIGTVRTGAGAARAGRGRGRGPFQAVPRRVESPRHTGRGTGAAGAGARRPGHDHPGADGLAGEGGAAACAGVGETPVTCSDLHAAAASLPPARKLAASLDPPGTDADPCLISSAGGYQRLENQLYRVQVHDGRGGRLRPGVPVVAGQRHASWRG